MFLIAQPKSASTSLTHTLGFILNKEALRQERLGKKVKEFNLLPHTDLINISEETLDHWLNDDKIYQQHLPPTKHNLDLLRKLNAKCIISLRCPKDSYNAYLRQPDIKKFIDKIEKNGQIEASKLQLQSFNNLYLEECKFNSNLLPVFYEDLIKDVPKFINLILEFYGFENRVDKNFKLLKYRYTNNGRLPYQYFRK